MFSKIRTLRRLLTKLDYLDSLSGMQNDLKEVRKLLEDVGPKIDAVESSLQSTQAPSAESAPYWPEIDAVIRLHLTPDDTVFDIGANQGLHSAIPSFFMAIVALIVDMAPVPSRQG